MNKLLIYIILICFPVLVSGQATVNDSVSVITEAALSATDTVNYTQREFEPGFKERYKADEFIYEIKPKPKTAWDRFLEWLRDLLDSIFGPSDEEVAEEKGGISWGEIITKLVAAILIIFVIYVIASSIAGKEIFWIFKRSGKKISINEIMNEDLAQVNFKDLINETKQSGNYRLATRYYYLWLLKLLTYREIIEWHPDKTNSDYLYEINNPGLRKDFEYLSYIYEYIWYGEFAIDEEAFTKAEKAFIKTLNTL
ncbi:DUF4129 domain-containing protein [Flavobacterium alkalisoli]|uniref:DUF4129 domain-containing protein n=1 Tax=Flavobacterium alkalisoli TaxID=2602769 RepID=A0A5B9FY27_9FLAO|nr:DUF4129 domain-containing protein [Flavobacterium alkalisoli]QEE51309.1 DUF4129 domain-containing protein [Flavobacterium alkalisoli]